jgi:hypothetical protein
MRGLLLLGLCIALIVTQSGCPGGADLEHPEAWPGRLSGSTGSSGTGGTSGGNWALDPATVNCNGLDPAVVIGTDCAKIGCHRGTVASAGLDLTFSTIAAKTKDVPAKYLDIQCNAPTDPYVECVPAACPPAGSELLVDSSNPDESWILKKLHDTTNGCGDAMPLEAPYPSGSDRSACVEAIVRAIAALK